MAGLILRRFEPADASQALEAEAEFATGPDVFLPGFDEASDFSSWLGKVDHVRAGCHERVGWLRAEYLAAWVGDELVGRISVRFEGDPGLLEQVGHIGYVVRVHHRGRGYATEMLRHATVVAREGGLGVLVVGCAEDNAASATVIERCGGVLSSRFLHQGRPFRRYQIPAQS